MKINDVVRTVLLAALLAASGATSAATLVWDFLGHGHNVDLGPTSTFDTTPASGNLITAAGFSAGAPTALFAKFTSGSPSETGLGLFADPTGQHEIFPNAFISLGVNTVLSKTYTITLGSLQSYTTGTNENATIYESATAGVLGTALGTFSGPPVMSSHTFTLDTGDTYFQIVDNSASGGENVLIDSLSTRIPSPVPLPASLPLLGFGLAGVGFLLRRRRGESVVLENAVA